MDLYSNKKYETALKHCKEKLFSKFFLVASMTSIFLARKVEQEELFIVKCSREIFD